MELRSSHSSPPYLLRRPLLLITLLYCFGLIVADRCGLLGFPPPAPQFPEGRRTITGDVVDAPNIWPDQVTFPIEVEGSRAGVRVTVKGLTEAPVVGDRLRLRGYLKIPAAPTNPGSFDYRRFLWQRNLTAALTVKAPGFLNLGDSHRYPVKRLAHRTALGITHSLERCLNPEEAAVFAGLTLGIKPHAFPEVERAFRDSGTIHVLIASGFKVAFFIGLWMLLARRVLKLPKRAALVGSIPWAIFYGFVAGGNPPVARSCLMATVGILGYLMAREDRAYHSLGLSALCLLLWNPRFLFDLSFQMSYAGVFGLIHYAPMIASLWRLCQWTGARHHRAICAKALVTMTQALATTTAAQLWLFPIFTVSFHRVPLISPLSNLIIIPLSAVGLQAGLALAVLERLTGWTHLAVLVWSRDLLALGCSWLARATLFIAREFAHLGSTWFPTPSPGWVVLFYVVLFCAAWVGKSSVCRWTTSIGTAILILWFHWAWSPQPGVTWLDVGQADAVVIHCGGGKTLLVYGGERKSGIRKKVFDVGERIILPYLAYSGVRRLSGVFLTHPNPADVRQLRSVMSTLPVERIFFSVSPGWTGRFGAARIECLWSNPPALGVDFGDGYALLANDLPDSPPLPFPTLRKAQGRLFPHRAGEGFNFTVLQWPDRVLDEIDPQWPQAVKPSYLVISSMKRMPLFYNGIPVFCTKTHGAIFFRPNHAPPVSSMIGDPA